MFDKAYVVFAQLYALHARGLVWVTRAKEKMRCRVIESRPVCGKILRDEIVELTLWFRDGTRASQLSGPPTLSRPPRHCSLRPRRDSTPA